MKKIIILIIAIVVIGGGYYAYKILKQNGPGVIPQPVACTEEAKICPDGSAVGRVPPTCEFAACPNVGSSTSNTGEEEEFPFSADVSTWKVYRNEQYGLEFKYPPELGLPVLNKEEGMTGRITFPQNDIKKTYWSTGFEFGSLDESVKTEQETCKKPESCFEMNIFGEPEWSFTYNFLKGHSFGKYDSCDIFGSKSEDKECSVLNVNGNKALYHVDDPPWDDPIGQYIFLMDNGVNRLMWAYGGVCSISDTKSQLYLNCQKRAGIERSIFESVKVFPPASSVDSVSDWQTYDDKNFGFTFKYPPYFTVVIGSHLTPNGTDIVFGRKEESNFIKYDLKIKNTKGESVITGGIFESNAPNFGLQSFENELKTKFAGVISKFLINQNEAYRLASQGSGMNDGLFIQSQANLFMFWYAPNDPLVATILSTFKFTK